MGSLTSSTFRSATKGTTGDEAAAMRCLERGERLLSSSELVKLFLAAGCTLAGWSRELVGCAPLALGLSRRGGTSGGLPSASLKDEEADALDWLFFLSSLRAGDTLGDSLSDAREGLGGVCPASCSASDLSDKSDWDPHVRTGLVGGGGGVTNTGGLRGSFSLLPDLEELALFPESEWPLWELLEEEETLRGGSLNTGQGESSAEVIFGTASSLASAEAKMSVSLKSGRSTCSAREVSVINWDELALELSLSASLLWRKFRGVSNLSLSELLIFSSLDLSLIHI